MSEFSLQSVYMDNLSSFVDIEPNLKSDQFAIVINNDFRIELPKVVAASLFSSVNCLLKTDIALKCIPITINSERYIKNTLNKIKDAILTRKTVTIEDEEERRIFGEFGRSIGNKEFIKPMSDYLKKETGKISEENVISLIEMKCSFDIDDLSNEVSFIAENFEKMSKSESLFKFSCNTDNISILEDIIRSQKLRMKEEDTLLSFIIRVIRKKDNNTAYFHLFNYVLLEYCNIPQCREFINFFSEVTQTQSIKYLVSCVGRRLFQERIPMEPNFVEGRHKEIKQFKEEIIEYSSNEPFNGILRRENQKENILMGYSSSISDDIYDIINGKHNLFQTNSEKNSYFEASLKDNKSFLVKNYTIKGHHYGDHTQLKSWKLEGKRESDGMWVTLDEHKNDPFHNEQIRTFKVTHEEKVKLVRVTQTGENTSNSFHLPIEGFEIFGSIFF